MKFERIVRTAMDRLTLSSTYMCRFGVISVPLDPEHGIQLYLLLMLDCTYVVLQYRRGVPFLSPVKGSVGLLGLRPKRLAYCPPLFSKGLGTISCPSMKRQRAHPISHYGTYQKLCTRSSSYWVQSLGYKSLLVVTVSCFLLLGTNLS